MERNYRKLHMKCKPDMIKEEVKDKYKEIKIRMFETTKLFFVIDDLQQLFINDIRNHVKNYSNKEMITEFEMKGRQFGKEIADFSYAGRGNTRPIVLTVLGLYRLLIEFELLDKETIIEYPIFRNSITELFIIRSNVSILSKKKEDNCNNPGR